jgi:hypothetical protein
LTIKPLGKTSQTRPYCHAAVHAARVLTLLNRCWRGPLEPKYGNVAFPLKSITLVVPVLTGVVRHDWQMLFSHRTLHLVVSPIASSIVGPHHFTKAQTSWTANCGNKLPERLGSKQLDWQAPGQPPLILHQIII